MSAGNQRSESTRRVDTLFIAVPGAPVPWWADGAATRVLATNEIDSASDDVVQTLGAAGCVLVDAAAPGFVHAARAVHQIDSSVQVVAVAEPEAVSAARRALLYAPGLGEVWLASPGEIAGALTERARGVTRQRRRFARTRARIAAEQVTESPQRTARALISDAYLAGLLRALPDAVFSVDAEGRVLSANPAAERAFGTIDGRGVMRLIELLGVDGWVPGDEAALLERATREGVVTLKLRSADSAGGATVAELRAILLSPAAAAPAADNARVWAVVVHDVTAQTEAYEQLRDNAVELEAQTEELHATAAQLEERTEEAERARAVAEAASRARAGFLATMSHEIRTPINAIVGYTQLLDLGIPDAVTPAQRAQLARVAGAARHLLGLVDDVLDVAKIDAGEMRVTREAAPAARVIADALALVRPLAQQRAITIAEPRETAADVRYVGDERRVRQILVNLLSNAVKFTPPGGRIWIDCGTEYGADGPTGTARAGPWTLLRVRDTGIGIAPRQQSSVFEPFVQAESGHTRTAGGTGLGLTISRRLARLMGGDLVLESAVGEGTSFTLWLPATTGPNADAAAATGVARPARDRGSATGIGWRVRGLAETGRTLREAMDAAVEGYRVRLASDPDVPAARTIPPAHLENHALTLLADVAQSLVIIADGGENTASLLGDGTAIQRAVAETHGTRRFLQGWSEFALQRDHQLLHEAAVSAVTARANASDGDLSEGLRVLTHLLSTVASMSVASYRHAQARHGASYHSEAR